VSVQVASDEVLVRMYNVGFGDCFLLAFPAPDRTRKVLIDCGSHTAGRGPVGIDEIVARVVEDVTEDEGPRIDVVIGTHRHQDHVSGFKEELWHEVEVDEVWMPWTEHPSDPEARRIRERQSRVANRLTMALEASGDNRGAFELAQNALTNAEAMAMLHEGFAGSARRRFLPSGDPERDSFTIDALPGVQVHAIGPSRDPEVIRDMDPPVGGGYLRMLAAEDNEDARAQPFKGEWKVDRDRFLAQQSLGHLHLTERELQDIDHFSNVDFFQIAVSLEKAVNGTSLMLMFELGRALLLFPGDAQWGTWRAALAQEKWRALIGRTVFYKVGHHGSHNATPREFVEKLIDQRRTRRSSPVKDFSAAVSTRPIEMWKNIPKSELLEALRERTPKVVRSDEQSPVPGFELVDQLVVETRIPIRSRRRRHRRS
jgi:beta-lactamase superfamily II metal-dependent hydrolase